LRTKNRAEAQNRAEALVRALYDDGGRRERKPLTLGEHWQLYQQVVKADIKLITLSRRLNAGEGCGSVADWRGAGRTTM
jgi:hypothetical protein